MPNWEHSSGIMQTEKGAAAAAFVKRMARGTGHCTRDKDCSALGQGFNLSRLGPR